MSQHDMRIKTADANTGVGFRGAINDALLASETMQSGTTAPPIDSEKIAADYLYQTWIDTSASPPKVMTRKADGSFVQSGYVDGTGRIVMLSADTAGTCSGNAASATNDGKVQNCFRALMTTGQTINKNTYTKMLWSAEDFDIGSGFDLPNNKFQPSVAGYYNVRAVLSYYRSNPVSGDIIIAALYKNGSLISGPQGLTVIAGSSNTNGEYTQTSAIVYLNGIADYIEVYGYYNGGDTTASMGNNNVFEGSRIPFV